LSGLQTDDLQISACLARGGMSDVYVARVRGHTVPVAVKFERADLQQDDRQRFHREITIHRDLVATTALPRFLGAGRAFGRRYIAMELVDGCDLGLYAGIRPPSRNASTVVHLIDLFIGAFTALQELATAGIIHRDIKPANILVGRDGGVRLCDLGIATYRRGDPITDINRVLGTVGYMSPEQWSGHELDSRSDIYSMGITLLEVMSGLGSLARQDRHIAAYPDFRMPDELFADLARTYPPGLLGILARCLKVERRQRYRTPAAVIDDLIQLRSRLARVRPVDAHARYPRDRRRPLSWTTLAITMALITLVLLAIGLANG
jgi:serine/threonine-protein kinase